MNMYDKSFLRENFFWLRRSNDKNRESHRKLLIGYVQALYNHNVIDYKCALRIYKIIRSYK